MEAIIVTPMLHALTQLGHSGANVIQDLVVMVLTVQVSYNVFIYLITLLLVLMLGELIIDLNACEYFMHAWAL